MATISGEDHDLEAISRVDSSWHPCSVSLSSKNATIGIVVAFEKFPEEETIYSQEEALRRLRYRSSPLLGGQCLCVKEGECILALYKSQCKNLFFDAVIIKSCRVRHSPRVLCRCTFEITWKSPELMGRTETVSSTSIRKLSDKAFESHPIFAEFRNSLHPLNNYEAPSFLSLVDNTNYDGDTCDFLEKQIEEISSLADGSNMPSEDFILKIGVGAVTTKNLKRTTRSHSKQKVGEDLKKPCLPPLAARAALASLVPEAPQVPELRIHQAGKSGDFPLPSGSPKKLHAEIKLYGVTFLKNEAPADSKPHDLVGGDVVEEGGVKKLLVAFESPKLLPMKEKQAEEGQIMRGVSGSADGKQSCPDFPVRLTRSAARKEMSNSAVEVERVSPSQKPTSLPDLVAAGRAKLKKKNPKTELEEDEEAIDTTPVATRTRGVPPESLVVTETQKRKIISSVESQRKIITRSSGSAATECEDSGRDACSQVTKKAGLNDKFAVRSSPRLRLFSRTRRMSAEL